MKTYTANQVADFFRAKSKPELGDVLSNLKIQKLCYYAAGVIAAVRRDNEPPLFPERIEAWQHGPVVPDLYHRFKEHGSGEILPLDEFDFEQFDPADLAVLDDICEFYGQYSAWKLRNMTHEERPWVEAFPRADKTISTAALRQFFSEEVGEAYIESYNEKARQREAV